MEWSVVFGILLWFAVRALRSIPTMFDVSLSRNHLVSSSVPRLDSPRYRLMVLPSPKQSTGQSHRLIYGALQTLSVPPHIPDSDLEM